MTPRVFGCDYQFMACGSVFTDGLMHAAADLGIPYAHADWNSPSLPGQIERFQPDLLFVVHGRKFVRKWPQLPRQYRSAVWLLDEPYEVDDTSTFSPKFSQVFVNDNATLQRHRDAVYLRVCYDPHVHFPSDAPRPLRVGFIGGGNTVRERYLSALATQGLLTYVVGGAWSHPKLNALSRGRNIPPAATADLYRQTRIVINVFREQHHYNRYKVAGWSMNPRIYEALACGALVVSEPRPEITQLVPELPTFRNEDELIALVASLLAEPERAAAIQRACADRLKSHTYAYRLQTVLNCTVLRDAQTVGVA